MADALCSLHGPPKSRLVMDFWFWRITGWKTYQSGLPRPGPRTTTPQNPDLRLESGSGHALGEDRVEQSHHTRKKDIARTRWHGILGDQRWSVASLQLEQSAHHDGGFLQKHSLTAA